MMGWIILCGFFCAGKSIVGRGLAERLNLPFYDTDQLMVEHYGKPQGVIWEELGANRFRKLETRMLQSIEVEKCIVATGGGTLLRQQNRLFLKERGISIYLKASLSTLWERIERRGLPRYAESKEACEQIATFRFPIYEGHCVRWVETDRFTEKEVISIIAKEYA